MENNYFRLNKSYLFPTNFSLLNIQYPSIGIVLYDIYQNTVKVATTSLDVYGTDLVEFCRNGKMFTSQIGTAVKSYLAPDAAGISTWKDETTSLSFGRRFATTVTVPLFVVNGLTGFPSGCSGCWFFQSKQLIAFHLWCIHL